MENSTNIENITDTLESALTGIPTPVRKNFWKAFGQLCTASVDVPVAFLEGKAAEIRTLSEARRNIIKTQGDSMSQKVDVPEEYLAKAGSKYASKIIKEQINLDDITKHAADDLTSKQLSQEASEAEINDDWLNEFENHARLKSSEDMKLIFGKILSGEISKPGTFSIKTIKLVSQLDNEAAILFQKLCSICISMRVNNEILDARVVSFNGNPGSNSLLEYGLSFTSLNILEEYGLIISDYNSYMVYMGSIVLDGKYIAMPLRYNNKEYGWQVSEGFDIQNNARFPGITLTKSGRELLDIIPKKEDERYTKELFNFFNKRGLNPIEIQVS